MKIFLDTNVLLDVILNREDEEQVKTLISLSRQDSCTRIYASYLSMANMAYILRKNGVPFVQDCLRDVMKWCNILSCNDMQLLKSVSCASEDFEDTLQILCAESNACDVIITRNPDHFRPFTDLPVLTPQDFVRRCR